MALALALVAAATLGCDRYEPPPTGPSSTESPEAQPAGEDADDDALDAANATADESGDDPDGAPASQETAEATPSSTETPSSTASAGGGDVGRTTRRGVDAATATQLEALLDELTALAEAWNPTGRSALAVVTSDGSRFGVSQNRQHISASAVKPIWAAAALHHVGVDPVAPLAHDALVRSDNFAAGRIIDLAGVDNVNSWTTEVAGLSDTHLASWRFGSDSRVAQSVRDGGSRTNFTSVGDLALFYARLRRAELLSIPATAALEGWLEATPRDDRAVDGALLVRLPSQAVAESVHKAGWLPPYCCAAEVRLLLDGGVIPLPGHDWFAIAAVADRGEDYNLSVRWVSLAACRVYVLLAADDDHICDRPGDGVPRPDLWRPPPEPEPEEDAPIESEPGDDVAPFESDPGESDPTADPGSEEPFRPEEPVELEPPLVSEPPESDPPPEPAEPQPEPPSGEEVGTETTPEGGGESP